MTFLNYYLLPIFINYPCASISMAGTTLHPIPLFLLHQQSSYKTTHAPLVSQPPININVYKLPKDSPEFL